MYHNKYAFTIHYCIVIINIKCPIMKVHLFTIVIIKQMYYYKNVCNGRRPLLLACLTFQKVKTRGVHFINRNKKRHKQLKNKFFY